MKQILGDEEDMRWRRRGDEKEMNITMISSDRPKRKCLKYHRASIGAKSS